MIDVIPIVQGENSFQFVLHVHQMNHWLLKERSRPFIQLLLMIAKMINSFSDQKDVKGIFQNGLTSINFDPRYYQNDNDIKNNLV